jgi:hypothetical protein
MSKSKFQELAEIAAADQTKTYEYLDKLFAFIAELRQKFADNFGCSLADLSFSNPEGGTSPGKGRAEDSTIIRDDGFFEFWLVINLPVQPFNKNTFCHSFIEKSLDTPLAVGILMAVKQEEDLFIVELSRSQSKTFEIDLSDESSWINLFECCFEYTKAIFEGGLERRISELGTLKDNVPKQNFGFNIG